MTMNAAQAGPGTRSIQPTNESNQGCREGGAKDAARQSATPTGTARVTMPRESIGRDRAGGRPSALWATLRAMPKVQMPQLGESVAEGTIGKWLKKPGDHVDKYEPIVEVITDKVNAEVPSPFEGTLTEILAQEGETVPNGAEIATVEAAGAAADANAAKSA